MKLRIQKTSWPRPMRELAQATGEDCLILCAVVNGCLQVFVTREMGLLHLSVSHPKRYPTWDELKALRYQLLPDAKTFAILFPPAAQYVNVHPNCFHLHEVPELHEGRPA